VIRSSLAAIMFLFLLPAAEVRAQEWICDGSFQDCRTPLLNLIHAERTGIDVAFPLMTDGRYADALIGRWLAGVPVRVLVDAGGAGSPAHADVLQRLLDAGIPVRARVAGGPLHWTLMLFAGQRVLQVGGGGYTARAFVPVRPYVEHGGAIISFSDDPAMVGAFMTQYDREWTSPAYADRGTAPGPAAPRYPEFGDSPEMAFSAGSQNAGTR
jgi:hypothetical protein